MQGHLDIEGPGCRSGRFRHAGIVFALAVVCPFGSSPYPPRNGGQVEEIGPSEGRASHSPCASEGKQSEPEACMMTERVRALLFLRESLSPSVI